MLGDCVRSRSIATMVYVEKQQQSQQRSTVGRGARTFHGVPLHGSVPVQMHIFADIRLHGADPVSSSWVGPGADAYIGGYQTSWGRYRCRCIYLQVDHVDIRLHVIGPRELLFRILCTVAQNALSASIPPIDLGGACGPQS
jgi:hypothetical protein